VRSCQKIVKRINCLANIWGQGNRRAWTDSQNFTKENVCFNNDYIIQ